MESCLLYKLSELRVELSTSLIKLIASILTDRLIKILVEGEFSTQKKKKRQYLLEFLPMPK
jgi:hypothetical protein